MTMKGILLFLIIGVSLLFIDLKISIADYCSYNGGSCYEVTTLSVVANVSTSFESLQFDGIGCFTQTTSGDPVVVEAGDSYYQVRYRILNQDGTYGDWNDYWVSGVDPGSPPRMSGDSIIDACDGLVDPCDTADDDGDGICNSCDERPGEPDPDDCLFGKYFNVNTGETATYLVKSCDSDYYPHDWLMQDKRFNVNPVSQGDYYMLHVFDYKKSIGHVNCDNDDAVCCNYDTSDDDPPIEIKPNPLDPDSVVYVDLNEFIQDDSDYTNSDPSVDPGGPDNPSTPEIEDIADDGGEAQDDDKQNCADLGNSCNSTCASHGGVGGFVCKEGSTSVHSTCTCVDDLIVEDSGRPDPVDPSSVDTDGDGIPDIYDVDSNPGAPDTDGDGVIDSGDVDNTGGDDTNNDGIDDGQLNALIGRLDRANSHLNQISSNTANIGNALGGMGDALAGIGDSLEEIKENQEEGYELVGEGTLPEDNEYDTELEEVEEDSLSDAITSYLSSGIPILSYIRGTSLQLSNASSSMTVNLWGDSVQFDLAPMADILDMMGYILSGISVIVAFGIIVGRG